MSIFKKGIPTEKKAEKPVEQPKETIVEKPKLEIKVEKPKEVVIEKPVEKKAEKPIEQPKETIVEKPKAEKPKKVKFEQPKETEPEDLIAQKANLSKELKLIKSEIDSIRNVLMQHIDSSAMVQSKSDKHEVNEELINEFLKFINNANPDDYQSEGQIIRAIQKYKRNSRVVSVLRLFNQFLKKQ